MPRDSELTGFRASIFHCLGDPGASADGGDAVEYIEDGLLLVREGRVERVGHATELLITLPGDVKVVDYPDKLIVPGFIDCHVHYPQTDMIASSGEYLIDWLEQHTYPTERRFDEREHADAVAAFFVEELLRNGTTSALVFATVHPESVDAIFTQAEARNLRLQAGKVLMDRIAPEYLRDTAESGYRDSEVLIGRWHGRGRLSYAITPRFALTSSEEQLRRAGELATAYPDTLIHSHVAESEEEVAAVAGHFPWSRSYLDVYDRFGLLRERAVYAHCIHLDEQDRARMAATGAAMIFCPTSNLFLGSGLFDLAAADAAGARVALATDVGGGTSFSMLRTMSEAYKVLRLQGQGLSAARAWYLTTLGAARALCLDDRIGNFVPGKEADFAVLDYAATPLLERRIADSQTPWDRLFAMMMLGDDRAVSATYLMGELEYARCGPG